jgi:hypothetical protein
VNVCGRCYFFILFGPIVLHFVIVSFVEQMVVFNIFIFWAFSFFAPLPLKVSGAGCTAVVHPFGGGVGFGLFHGGGEELVDAEAIEVIVDVGPSGDMLLQRCHLLLQLAVLSLERLLLSTLRGRLCAYSASVGQ